MNAIVPVHRFLGAAGCALIVGLSLALAGCEKSASARFVLNSKKMHDEDITLERQQAIANVLEAMFGTPDEPVVLPQLDMLSMGKLRLAAGPSASDESGYKGGLYRRHCVHCHGVSGDGAGPTAVFLNPYPRDFRHGNFKFKSTELGVPPTDPDLLRTINDGLAGTVMPSFRLLTPVEKDALVEYVKYLSIRGETELKLIEIAKNMDDKEPYPEGEALRALVNDEVLPPILNRWRQAPKRATYPPPRTKIDPDSIRKGRDAFYGAGQCFKCHGDSSLGDGQFFVLNAPPGAANAFREKLFVNEQLPPQTLNARNLRLGVIRGGKRPIDIFRRIRNGMDEGIMPAAAPAAMSDEQVWNLVDYVLNIPYEPADATTETQVHRPVN